MSDFNDPRAEVQVLNALLTHIAANEIRLYRSLAGADHFSCSAELEIGDTSLPAITCALASDDAVAWLTAFGFRHSQVLLKRDVVLRMQQVLKTLALQQPLTGLHDAEALQVLQTEPVVAAVVEFMHLQQGGRVETTMEDWYVQLKDFAVEHRLLVRGVKRFPGGANVLGRQIRKFEAVLRALGVQIEVKRSNGSKVILTRLGNLAKELSADPSAEKTSSSHDLSQPDGKARILAELAARRINEESQTKEK